MIVINPHGSGSITNQKLMIYPTVGDGDHIHMSTGNLYETELFLGTDDFYVKLANTGNVIVNSNDGIGNTHSWTFDTNGNLTLPGNTFAVNYSNGTQASLGGSYSNSDVANYLPTYTGNLSANYFVGNGSTLTYITGSNINGNVTSSVQSHYANIANSVAGSNVSGQVSNSLISGTVYTNAQPNITSVGTLTSLTISGNVTANNLGNISSINLDGNVSNVLAGDGTWVTASAGGTNYGNSNVSTFLASFGSNSITTTGNVSAGNITLTGNLTVNGSPIYGVSASYAKYTRSTSQTGLSTNGVIVCNVSEAAFGSDITVDTSTGNVTLVAGRTYRLRGQVGHALNGGSPCGMSYQWYNATTSAYVGQPATVVSESGTPYDAFNHGTSEYVITPGSTTVMQLRVTNVTNTSSISSDTGTGSYQVGAPFIDVEVIGGQAPITGFTTTGNVTGNYFIGNGSQLTGLPSSYTNSNVTTFLASFGSNSITTTGNVSAGNIGVASITATANISTSGYFISGNQATGGFQLGNSNSRLKSGDSNSYMTMGQNPAIYPDTAASALAGVLIGGSGYILGPNGGRNITLNYGGTTGIVGLQANIQVGTGGSGTILVPGTVNTGVNSILAGPTFTPLANTMAGFVSNINSYTQLTIQNKNTGADATTDFVATADNGSDTVNYLDLGIINSGYDNGTPTNSLGNIVYAADSYIYAQGNTSATGQSGGNLAIGTTVASKTVKIFAGGVTSNSIVASFANTGANITGSLNVSGNITGANISGNISITGNIQGTSSNVSLVAGSYTMTFDNTGKLVLPSIGGDEGGEINFGIPASNTTLTTRVVVDVFQDRVRFFDGSTKGAYIDLSQAGVGVSTLLNNRVSGFVNAGTFVTMDLIKATVTTSGNRGLSLATTTGTFVYNIGGNFGMNGNGSGGQSLASQTLTTTATSSIFGWGFSATGDISTYILTDTTNSRCYRITVMIGASFNNNAITIERLI